MLVVDGQFLQRQYGEVRLVEDKLVPKLRRALVLALPLVLSCEMQQGARLNGFRKPGGQRSLAGGDAMLGNAGAFENAAEAEEVERIEITTARSLYGESARLAEGRFRIRDAGLRTFFQHPGNGARQFHTQCSQGNHVERVVIKHRLQPARASRAKIIEI